MSITTDGEARSWDLNRQGGLDIWLPPLAMIGCVVVTGPALAVALMDMPEEWVHDNQLLLGLVLVGGVLAVLLLAFWGAMRLIRWLERRLWSDGERVAVTGRSPRRVFEEVDWEEVGVEQRNYIIRSPRGYLSSPVLWFDFPNYGRMTVGVESTNRHWPMEGTPECEEEAYYHLQPREWEALLKLLGLEDDEVYEGDSKV